MNELLQRQYKDLLCIPNTDNDSLLHAIEIYNEAYSDFPPLKPTPRIRGGRVVNYMLHYESLPRHAQAWLKFCERMNGPYLPPAVYKYQVVSCKVTDPTDPWDYPEPVVSGYQRKPAKPMTFMRFVRMLFTGRL